VIHGAANIAWVIVWYKGLRREVLRGAENDLTQRGRDAEDFWGCVFEIFYSKLLRLLIIGRL